MQEIPVPMRWVIRGEGEDAKPVFVPENQIVPGEQTLFEARDLQPLQATTTFRYKGESIQIEQ